MALLKPLWSPLNEISDYQIYLKIFFFAFLVLLVLAVAFYPLLARRKSRVDSRLQAYYQFFWSSFLKPHKVSNEKGQQAALESFYQTQATVYDATRKHLLHGREDMLGLVSAQLQHRRRQLHDTSSKLVWADIGGGTGYNIEAMQNLVDLDIFERIYLIDLSPSLCEIALQRVKKLGWRNVTVICQDARAFRPSEASLDLITMSYSLSMIPDFYSVVDSLSSMLSPTGIIGACDFYVQSIVDVSSRNYIGGTINRHVNWFGRMFWRAWFDADRVNLDGGRRDFLEYRFGTIISVSERNYVLGGIPFYIYVGCARESQSSKTKTMEKFEELDAALTESPYLSPQHYQEQLSKEAGDLSQIRSKAYESAVVNLSFDLPLPSAFYQNHHWRIFYNDLLQKHQQFNNEYLYAFNWEDVKVDCQILNIQKDDIILAITSAGDNVLDYMLEGPKKIHAVDLNPNQNHLLELKVAAFTALSASDIWEVFGNGRHENFRTLLIEELSPHLSSQALQYWLNHSSAFTSTGGLYETGGSRHAIKLVRHLFRLLGLTHKVRTMCSVETLNEQREIWPAVRRVLMSWPLHWAVISSEWWAWKAAGVPPAQSKLIYDDYAASAGSSNESASASTKGKATWEYMVNTLDPVADKTLMSNDNYFYYLCLQGKYSRKCHPRYLSRKAHAKLSRKGAFDGLRIHTDEIVEVVTRMAPSTLTIAVVMDSMDWFNPKDNAAIVQVLAFKKALKTGGRILLRSAALSPWYIQTFEEYGFACKCVAKRTPGSCIDRVNMYASTWLCTKVSETDKFLLPDPAMALGEKEGSN